MHSSDSIKSTLLAVVDEIAADPGKFVVHPGKDFSRNRKMGLKDTLLMLLTMEGDCIEYSGAAEPPFRWRVSQVSGRN